MDIDLLSKMVKELILARDTVELPGIGTFVAEMAPAAFSDRGFTINPPYRRLYFRPRVEGDTTLADFYASSNNISPELARKVLTDFLTDLKQVLKEKKTIIFPRLGRLRATRENHFFFVPDEDLDIYPEGFGLVPISLKNHTETKEELAAAVENLKSIIEPDVLPDNASVSEPAPSSEAGSAPEQEEEAAIPESPRQEEPVPPAPEAPAGPRPRRYIGMKIALALLAVLILLILYMLIAQLFPGVFDALLYNGEERRILEYFSF